jgi:hypothetical protein
LTNDLKLKIYPAVIAILGLSLVALMLSRIEIQVSDESAIPTSRIPESNPIPSPDQVSPSPKPSPSVVPSAIPTPAPPPAPAAPTAQGGLRVSNQTAFPVRVALLYQQGAKPESPPAPEQADSFNQPVHWDFAPEEGEAKGLIMSLPNGDLRLRRGDVLVAFAQDGSRRYWGPYVVGKTALPSWSNEQKEWTLPLR